MDIASGGVFFFSPLGKYAPAVQQSFGGIRAIQHGATFRVLRPDLTPLPPIEPTMSDFSRTGDMNGDGFADLAVVAPLEPYLDVSVFAGGRMGLSNIPVATLGSSTGAAQQAGLCGDMNGDGYDDLAVIYRVSTENWFLAVFNGASAAAATSSWVIRMNRSSRLCD